MVVLVRVDIFGESLYTWFYGHVQRCVMPCSRLARAFREWIAREVVSAVWENTMGVPFEMFQTRFCLLY